MLLAKINRLISAMDKASASLSQTNSSSKFSGLAKKSRIFPNICHGRRLSWFSSSNFESGEEHKRNLKKKCSVNNRARMETDQIIPVNTVLILMATHKKKLSLLNVPTFHKGLTEWQDFESTITSVDINIWRKILQKNYNRKTHISLTQTATDFQKISKNPFSSSMEKCLLAFFKPKILLFDKFHPFQPKIFSFPCI